MTKPRFVVETDEDFKTRVIIKATMQGKTIKEVILHLLKVWVRK